MTHTSVCMGIQNVSIFVLKVAKKKAKTSILWHSRWYHANVFTFLNLWLIFLDQEFKSVHYIFHSVLIGAPRAQSTLEVQRKINETGAIYKCGFDKLSTCSPFVFDRWGNVHEDYNQYAYNNEKKDYQWLGATMDGSASDTDKFVVRIENTMQTIWW